MAKKRKEKVEESKANRIKPITPTVNATPELKKSEPLAKIEPDDRAFQWVDRHAVTPQGIRERMAYAPLGKMEAYVPGETKAPKGVYSTESVTPTPAGKAAAQNPTGIKNPAIEAAKEATKPKTLSELLADQRKAAVKDKTDAAKMQKYYALTDAFNALGKMGGVAVGGAIGGNMLDSAPIVADYQPSRGYIDAFEKAKQANDRIRALDEKVFNLAARDEERAYNDKVRAADRKYQEEQNKLNREFQAEQNRLTREWNKAVADKDFERQAALKKEMLDLQDKYAAADDKRSRDYLQLQHDLYNTEHPVMFSDGSVINMSTQQLEDMLENFKGQTVGGVKINEENFGTVLRQNPQAFANYFKMIGVSPTGAATIPATQSTDAQETSDSETALRTNFVSQSTQQALGGREYGVKEEDYSRYKQPNK